MSQEGKQIGGCYHDALVPAEYFRDEFVGGNTGWCLTTTEADSFVVWLTLGNIVHGEPKKIIFIFEKSAVAFLAGLPMGFAWYIRLWAPVGPIDEWLCHVKELTCNMTKSQPNTGSIFTCS